MNTQHTPGPWRFDGKIVSAKNQPNVCRLENGHLIASAPDLLAASINVLALLAQINAICISGKRPALGVIRELARDAAGPVRAAVARATGKEGAK
jgi:hypothetical protein